MQKHAPQRSKSDTRAASFSSDARLSIDMLLETNTHTLMKRKMNEEMLHYSARERCGY